MPRFSHETHYCFDSAVEMGELTADVPLVLMMFAPADAAIEHRVEHGPFDPTDNFADYVTERADELLAGDCDQDLVRAIMMSSVMMLAQQTAEASRDVAHQLAMEITDYGSRLPYRRLIRRAHGARYQWDVLAKSRHMQRLRTRARRLFRYYHRYIRPGFDKACMERLDIAIESYYRAGSPARTPRPFRPTARQRAVFRRAVKMARAVVGEHALYDFLKGNPVVIIGRNFHFRVSRRHIFADNASVGITLCDLQSEPIADLCLFFENTPAIDQLIAIQLHCQAQIEEELVFTANVLRVYDRVEPHASFNEIRDRKVRSAGHGLTSADLLRNPFVGKHEDWSTTYARHLEWEVMDKVFSLVCDNSPKMGRKLRELYEVRAQRQAHEVAERRNSASGALA